ncbi:MAG: DNA methyltransferase [Chthoniobacterales bacterium]
MEDRVRRRQGAHYTSERDIMKVIRSLFLDELRAGWERVKVDRSTRRRASLEAFHQRLRSLQFLDPACGCGTFLVLAYRELRTLEIDVVRELAAGSGGQQLLPIVNVDQFHGIEYSEWPVRIAEVALWLMDHQMNAEAGEVFGQPIDRLPLTSAPHIVHGNALHVDWNTVLPRDQCSYVMGNPPFVGHQWRNVEQQEDMARIWGENGRFDYVTCWFRRGAEYIAGTTIPVAFVATNSISQGEQVGILWGDLFSRGVGIDFAHRTFNWASEARGAAQVDVVIIGFSLRHPAIRRLHDYDGDEKQIEATVSECANISPYLVVGPNLAFPH